MLRNREPDHRPPAENVGILFSGNVTVVHGLINVQQVAHAAAIEEGLVGFPVRVGGAALFEPLGFVFSHGTLKVGAVEVDIVQLCFGEYAILGIEGEVLHKLEEVVVGVRQTIHGAVFHS